MGENKTIKYIGLALLIVVFAVGGFFLGKRTAETENLTNLKIQKEEKPAENTLVEPGENTPEQTVENTPTEETTPVTENFVLKKVYRDIDLGEETIFFRDDNTFRINSNLETVAFDYVGIYEIKENQILLNTKVRYDTMGCYYKSDTKVLDPSIFLTTIIKIENDKLYYTDYSKNEYELIPIENVVESSSDIKEYNINPINTSNHKECF